MQRPGSIGIQVSAIDLEVLLQRDVGDLCGARLDVGTDLEPAGWQLLADVIEVRREVLDPFTELVARTSVLEVGGVAFPDVVVLPLDACEVDGLAPPALLILEDQHRAATPEQIDE